MIARAVVLGAVLAIVCAQGGGAEGGASLTAATYAGPNILRGSSVLRVSLTNPDNVVAVTYRVDGHPFATSTAPPFFLRLTPGDVAPGAHALSLEVVAKDGRRIASPAVAVRAEGQPRATVTASPGHRVGAALRALSRGHATVILERGVFELHDIRLGDGAQLVGRPGSIIRAPADSYSTVLFVDGRDVRIAGVTIDGGGQGPGNGEAIAVGPHASRLRVSRVRIVHIRRSGLYAWGSFSDISLQDSVLLGDDLADEGVVVGLRDGGSRPSVVRCTIRGFRQYGITFAQSGFGQLQTGLGAVALDNIVTDIDDPARDNGTDEGGIWSGGPEAAIVGNTIRRATWDGIETVGSSERTLISDNIVTDTRTGIYVEHSTNHSVIARNTIRRVQTGINVEWRYGGVGSSNNVFSQNLVEQGAKAGIFVDVGSDENLLRGNRLVETPNAIQLQGASRNLVTQNVLCGSGPPRISETNGMWEDGSAAVPSQNVIQRNRVARSC
jgi:parallel beta-helix repeat protein